MSKFLVIIVLFTSIVTSAQPTKWEESVPFVEPREGWLKLMQLDNGNTALLTFNEDDNLNFKLYNTSRKLIVDKPVVLKFEGKNGAIMAVMNIGNDLVIFIAKGKGTTPVLYRAVIDAGTGSLKKSDEIGELKKLTMADGYAMAFGNVPLPRFEVRKDPHSNSYGVAFFDALVSERSKRIQLMHFSADHQLLNKAYYTSPNNEEFKYMELIDFVVLGDSKIVASAYVFNSKGGESFLSIASLKAGSKTVESKVLPFTANMKFTAGLMRYNKHEGLVAVLGLNYLGADGSERHYKPVFSLINPDNLDLAFTKVIDIPAIDSEYKKLFGAKKEYAAVPQDLYINEDNTYSIVFQEMRIKTVRSSSHTTITPMLGSVAVALLNSKANEVSGFLIPMDQQMSYVVTRATSQLDYGPMYVARREESAQVLKDGIQFKSFAYVNGKSGNYIFFNDLMENTEMIKKGKLTTVKSVSDTDAVVYTMKGGAMNRELLFGDPGKAHNFALFTVSSYNPKTGVYATLKMENDQGKKMKVVWRKL